MDIDEGSLSSASEPPVEASSSANDPAPLETATPEPAVPEPLPEPSAPAEPARSTPAPVTPAVTAASPAADGSAYRKASVLSAAGWPTFIVSWAASAAIASTGFDDPKEKKVAAVGAVPLVGAPIAVIAGDFSLGSRLGLAATGAVQIAGFVLGVVGAVKMKRAANLSRVGVGPQGLWVRF